MEELYEWEVMWPESDDDRRPTGVSDGRVSSKTKARARGCSTTAAMVIPNGVRTSRENNHTDSDHGNDDDHDADDDAEFTPPHILTSRRAGGGGARKVAFSLCSGQGRTLKGRDLSYVRNSVLRMTGFLEA